MESLDKKIRNVWIATSTVIGLIIGLIAASLTQAALNFAPLTAVVLIIFPVLMVAYSFYRYNNWFFQVHDDHLEINHGVLRKISMAIPYVRVQHIDTNRGPVERVLGLASLRVYTAGSKGADMRIPGLSKSRAEQMQEELKAKAIESEQGFDGV